MRTGNDDLVVYKLTDAMDLKQLFSDKEPGNKSPTRGYISGQDENENKYVLKMFRRSVERIG